MNSIYKVKKLHFSCIWYPHYLEESSNFLFLVVEVVIYCLESKLGPLIVESFWIGLGEWEKIRFSEKGCLEPKFYFWVTFGHQHHKNRHNFLFQTLIAKVLYEIKQKLPIIIGWQELISNHFSVRGGYFKLSKKRLFQIFFCYIMAQKWP